MDPQRTSDAEGLWDAMAAELVELIALYLSPMAAADVWLSQPLALPAAKTHWAESSVGAAHWVQLSQALTKQAPWPTQCLPSNRRSHRETRACCRVIEARDVQAEDWPLQVLRLRACADEGGSLLSHATPIARHTLRLAYWAVAKTVHPDRLQLGRDSATRAMATQAMAVLNEAYRQAQLYFSERTDLLDGVIRLDQLGLEHM
jgi:hypothetical protein